LQDLYSLSSDADPKRNISEWFYVILEPVDVITIVSKKY